jgi:hypothetical protein
MRYLGLALYAEGPTEYRFLPPLLHGLADDLCLRLAPEIVEVGEVMPLDAPIGCEATDRATRVLEAARLARGAFSILFLHTDGAGDPDAARTQRVQPAAGLLAGEPGVANARVVAVIPVRETEAWALADGDALRGAFGTTLSDGRLGLPGQPREVEAILDPKQALEDAFRRVVGRRQRKRKAVHHLDGIALRVRLEQLRRVPSFLRCEDELTAALVQLGILRKEAP